MLFHKCRCGALIPQNMDMCEACAAGATGQQSRHIEYNKHRRNKKAAAFYVSSEWRKTRAEAIRRFDGVDIYAFYELHQIQTADMVHHITPIEDDWNRRLDVSNLIPLSNHSHGIIEALYSKNEQTKKATQKMLYDLIESHWKAQGECKKVSG